MRTNEIDAIAGSETRRAVSEELLERAACGDVQALRRYLAEPVETWQPQPQSQPPRPVQTQPQPKSQVPRAAATMSEAATVQWNAWLNASVENLLNERTRKRKREHKPGIMNTMWTTATDDARRGARDDFE
jgi:hypothetical protein